MSTDQIAQYIAAERLSGATDDVIQKSLLEKGWRPQDVSAALSGQAPAGTRDFSFRHLFEGRMGRMEYFLTGLLLGLVVVLVAALVFFGFFFSSGRLTFGVVIGGLIIFFVLMVLSLPFSFSLTIRRLHDLGVSGWFCLLGFVPMVNFIFALALLFIPGKAVMNAYGLPPGKRSLLRALFNT